MAHDSSQNSSSSQQNIQLPKTDLNLDLEGINQEKNCAEFETAVLNKGISSTENATNAHPLMYSPVSPPGDTNVDVFPQEHVTKVNSDEDFNPKAHSSELDIEISAESQDSFEHKLNITLSALGDYNETLPEFPESPSVLKNSMMYDLPVEVTQTEFSDTENDKSVYEAHLSSNLQKVSLTMNEKEGNLNFLAHKKQSNKLRRVKVIQTEASADSDEVSSLDSYTESLKSEDVFTGTMERENDLENESQEVESPEPIEPLSADDERKHTRHWQRLVLPDGEQRTIDMRVIEPYKRVLSHGGYLRAGGHTAIVIFSACFLPDRSRIDYDYVMDNLFLYILWTLERLVTDDYILVYLHGGAKRLPAFSWIKKCYQMVGRRLRKNLSHLYLVHPTLWIRTMLFMAKPFISSKFYRKLSFIGSLRELTARVPLETAAIPEKVKAYDSLHCE